MSKVISALAKRFKNISRIDKLRKKLGRVDRTLGKSSKFRPFSQRPSFNTDSASKVARSFFQFSRDSKKLGKKIRISNGKSLRRLRRFKGRPKTTKR